jgi:hypothetical protein
MGYSISSYIEWDSLDVVVFTLLSSALRSSSSITCDFEALLAAVSRQILDKNKEKEVL